MTDALAAPRWREVQAQFVTDPAYLDMPFIRTHEFVLNPVVTNPGSPERMEIIDEIAEQLQDFVLLLLHAFLSRMAAKKPSVLC